jgi:predicted anti-sigma-YlaC factor YlaD
MTRISHEEARQLIALGEGLSPTHVSSLRLHLAECAPCRDYAEGAGRVVRSLRSYPIAAESDLVRSTQMRVRARSVELRRQQERAWLVCLSCVFVGLSAAITTPFFWRAFQWIGSWAGVSNWIWQAGFVSFWIVPALVVSALLLARGTHWNHRREGQWR